MGRGIRGAPPRGGRAAPAAPRALLQRQTAAPQREPRVSVRHQRTNSIGDDASQSQPELDEVSSLAQHPQDAEEDPPALTDNSDSEDSTETTHARSSLPDTNHCPGRNRGGTPSLPRSSSPSIVSGTPQSPVSPLESDELPPSPSASLELTQDAAALSPWAGTGVCPSRNGDAVFDEKAGGDRLDLPVLHAHQHPWHHDLCHVLNSQRASRSSSKSSTDLRAHGLSQHCWVTAIVTEKCGRRARLRQGRHAPGGQRATRLVRPTGPP